MPSRNPSDSDSDRGSGRARKPLDLELQRVRRELARTAPVVVPPTPKLTTTSVHGGRTGALSPIPRPVGRAMVVAAGLLAVGGLAVGIATRTHAPVAAAGARVPSPVVATCAPTAAPSQADEDFPRTPLDPLKPAPERFSVEVVNTGKTVDVRLGGIAGEPDDESYRALRHELRSNAGAESPLDPRLIELLHQIAKKTGGSVQVLSAFRSPKNRHDHNYHTRGMAADVRVAGMGTAALRDLARKLGAAGVGYYPTSHFVHVDVRDGHFEWTDTSGPGQNADDIPASDLAHAAPLSSASAAPTLEQALLAADAGTPGGERIARATPPLADPTLSAGQQAQQTAQPATE